MFRRLVQIIDNVLNLCAVKSKNIKKKFDYSNHPGKRYVLYGRICIPAATEGSGVPAPAILGTQTYALQTVLKPGLRVTGHCDGRCLTRFLKFLHALYCCFGMRILQLGICGILCIRYFHVVICMCAA